MLIDWFTVGAQALNFVVLVWLLKRFLYRPVLAAIDAREARIAQQLADAQALQREAQAQRDAYADKNASIAHERERLLAEAAQAAQAERSRLMAAAEAAATERATQRQQALQAEAAQLDQALRERVQQEVLAIARQALTDLAGVSLDSRMAGAFVQRLEALPAQARAALAGDLADLDDAANPGRSPAALFSATPLSPVDQAALTHAVSALAGRPVGLRFDTDPALVGGLELRTRSHRLAWTVAQYLDGLGQRVAEVVTPVPAAVTNPT